MPNDPNTVRVQVAEVNDRHAMEPLDQDLSCRSVPARHVGHEPAFGWGQVEVWTKILDEQERLGRRPHQHRTVSETSLGQYEFACDSEHSVDVEPVACAAEGHPRGRSQPNQAVT